MIPLERLGDYTDGIERINIEFSIANKLEARSTRLAEFFARRAAGARGREGRPRRRSSATARAQALRAARRASRERWTLHRSPTSTALAGEVRTDLEGLGMDSAAIGARRRGRRSSRACSCTTCASRGRRELREPLREIFGGRDFEPVMKAIEAIHAEVLRGRVFVALHMHAGDGNVHTNIPVNSDNYEMLQRGQRGGGAHHGVRARAGRRDLRRARHRHHQARVPHARGARALRRLQAARRSRGPLQPRQAPRRAPTSRDAYTPSFALIGHESLILEQNDIGAIADMFKDCLRCGKCKPVCATHVPRANLLYSPRNKILATSLLTEAFLYEEQTRRGVSIRHFDEYGDVADHCTVCHKCESPCPVDIDFGDVSIAMRNLLAKLQASAASTRHLGGAAVPHRAPTRRKIKLIKALMIDFGFRAQRFANKLWGRTPFVQHQTRHPPATVGKPPLKAQVIHFINKPMPGGLPKKTARALLDIEDAGDRADHPRPGEGDRGLGRGVLFPGLRLASASSARWASPRRRCSTTWAASACCRRATCAAAIRRPPRARADKGEKITVAEPRALPPRGQHAQLPRHQDRGGLVRHLHGPAAEVRIRQDLPRLPAARHPRVPDGEGREARGREGRALHVPRPLPHADEDLQAAQGGERS